VLTKVKSNGDFLIYRFTHHYLLVTRDRFPSNNSNDIYRLSVDVGSSFEGDENDCCTTGQFLPIPFEMGGLIIITTTCLLMLDKRKLKSALEIRSFVLIFDCARLCSCIRAFQFLDCYCSNHFNNLCYVCRSMEYLRIHTRNRSRIRASNRFNKIKQV
jgi:hypothetical protein